jgi:3-hydroxyacyl-CoA dehydrogenase
MKEEGSSGEFEPIYETLVESPNELVNPNSISGFQNIGLFFTQSIIDNNWTTSSAQAPATQNDDTIIASNTSSLSITEMAVSAKRPENIIGMHYFSPVPLMPLLEIVRTKTTADQVAAACYDIGVKQGKTCIIVKDSPGFYVNRILSPYMNEALLMVDEGGDVASIDRAIKAKGLPIGPLSLMDQVGLDICASVMSEEMLDQLDENQSGPISLSAKTLYDKGGLLGKKGGSGFYIYNKKTGEQIKFNPEVDKILARDQKIKIEMHTLKKYSFMSR